jgi:hypothetical protein
MPHGNAVINGDGIEFCGKIACFFKDAASPPARYDAGGHARAQTG